MKKFTSAETGQEGQPIAINPAHVIAVYRVFDDETRIHVTGDRHYIVAELYDDVLAALT